MLVLHLCSKGCQIVTGSLLWVMDKGWACNQRMLPWAFSQANSLGSGHHRHADRKTPHQGPLVDHAAGPQEVLGKWWGSHKEKLLRKRMIWRNCLATVGTVLVCGTLGMLQGAQWKLWAEEPQTWELVPIVIPTWWVRKSNIGENCGAAEFLRTEINFKHQEMHLWVWGKKEGSLLDPGIASVFGANAAVPAASSRWMWSLPDCVWILRKHGVLANTLYIAVAVQRVILQRM